MALKDEDTIRNALSKLFECAKRDVEKTGPTAGDDIVYFRSIETLHDQGGGPDVHGLVFGFVSDDRSLIQVLFAMFEERLRQP